MNEATPLKILLSAYACEPGRGSEPGVGWHWMLALAERPGVELHVVTRANNRMAIEAYRSVHPETWSVHFHYYDLPRFFLWLKHHGLGTIAYHDLWQMGMAGLARRLHREHRFTLAHHLTFGQYRSATLLYRLGIPLFIGPLGGGERTPLNLLGLYTFRQRMEEYLRRFIIKAAYVNPFLWRAYGKATLIFCRTEYTRRALILPAWRKKALLATEIGADAGAVGAEPAAARGKQLLFVGRYISWKGIKLVLRAFQLLAEEEPDATLVMVGGGDMEEYIRRFVADNGLTERVAVHTWMPQEEVQRHYAESRAMIFPSLHDSGGTVVLEALAHATPVVCLDCAGPAVVVGPDLQELVVPTHGLTPEEVARRMAGKLRMLCTDEAACRDLARRSLERARRMTWQCRVEETYAEIEKAVQKKREREEEKQK